MISKNGHLWPRATSIRVRDVLSINSQLNFNLLYIFFEQSFFRIYTFSMKNFYDRKDAGRQLAKALSSYYAKKDVLVLGLPRGGVPVAYEIAHTLHLPLNVLLVRKLGAPHQEELALGAIGEKDVLFLNEALIKHSKITLAEIQPIIAKEKKELKRRVASYRNNQPLPGIKNKTVILVDDGIATGATCKAAIQVLHLFKPHAILLAVPVASRESYEELLPLVDKIICLTQPEPFYGVGVWYEHFDQTTDQEVQDLLRSSVIK